MNAASVVLLVAVVLRSAGDGSLGPYLGAIRSEGPTALRDRVPVDTAAVGAPDVFLVILDGHARADKLGTIFGYDEAPFLAALETRGFEVCLVNVFLSCNNSKVNIRSFLFQAA